MSRTMQYQRSHKKERLSVSMTFFLPSVNQLAVFLDQHFFFSSQKTIVISYSLLALKVTDLLR